MKNIYRKIDKEIVRLINLKFEIEDTMNKIEFLKQISKNVTPISQYKYDEFLCNNMIRDDVVYIIVKKEVGQYIDGYIG